MYSHIYQPRPQCNTSNHNTNSTFLHGITSLGFFPILSYTFRCPNPSAAGAPLLAPPPPPFRSGRPLQGLLARPGEVLHDLRRGYVLRDATDFIHLPPSRVSSRSGSKRTLDNRHATVDDDPIRAAVVAAAVSRQHCALPRATVVAAGPLHDAPPRRRRIAWWRHSAPSPSSCCREQPTSTPTVAPTRWGASCIDTCDR
jgi:hypothetical protein